MTETEYSHTCLPGLMHRKKWASGLGKSDRFAKRLQDRGLIVVRYVGKQPYVDVEATAARIRGQDRPSRKPRAA